ncbi:hypothetical protein BS50DRAFT_604908 [Corynespora cassiicola Philippines]|uniref:Rhodopsin domain-containing protein n=1 Tax=Corynespora cassiicola Philippines TaxID=1448308 RepID=A0A2T2N3Q8_CORCC|nr:hypothetical protein BS50DRAFT_604908 [Corynespora cassiicola Philippines]
MSQFFDEAAIRPPPGVEANLINPEDHMGSNIALHSVFLTVVTLCVSMRLYTQRFITKQLGWEDGYMWGIGRHFWETPAAWIPNALKWSTISIWLYLPLLTACKLAIFAIYWRVFSTRRSARVIIIIGAFVVTCVNMSLFCVIISSCKPIERAWDLSVKGKCQPLGPASYASGAFNVLEDSFILIMPLFYLAELNLSFVQKLRVTAVFSLGILTLVASILRLVETKIMVTGIDSTRNISDIIVWVIIEVNVSIICSCLMLLPAFLEHHCPQKITKLFTELLTTWRPSTHAHSTFQSNELSRTFDMGIKNPGDIMGFNMEVIPNS